jgi:adenosylcobinamide-GDP ribazoletransferase
MLNRLRAAILFYTVLPVPPSADLDFRGIAFFAPGIGLIIGTLLSLVQTLLVWRWGVNENPLHHLFNAVVAVALWLGLTGGLHMDGAMDAADGLGVTDPNRRLAVMADSRAGAFGVMAGIMILLLKVVALSQLGNGKEFYLSQWGIVTAAVWSRWGQLVAILHDTYLKTEGKGKFHQDTLEPWHSSVAALLLLGLQILLGLGLSQWELTGFYLGIGSGAIGLLVSWCVRKWFASKFGGHTGDTYGAIVEWSEALILVGLVLAFSG